MVKNRASELRITHAAETGWDDKLDELKSIEEKLSMPVDYRTNRSGIRAYNAINNHKESTITPEMEESLKNERMNCLAKSIMQMISLLIIAIMKAEWRRKPMISILKTMRTRLF